MRRLPSARAALIAAVAAAVVAVDQASKTWALDHAQTPQHVVWTLRLYVTFNTGIAFSQATGSTPVVTAVALAVLATLVVFARRTQGVYVAIVLGLVIGGALGNLADRLVRHNGGAVIDFIDLRWWPVFNLADAAISIGVVLALARGLLAPSRHPAPR